MFETPIGEPSTLVSGTTWAWTRSFAQFPPSDGWSLTYYLTGPTSLSFTAADDGTGAGWAIAVPIAKTQPMLPGAYRWTAVATLSGASYPAGYGSVIVEPNPVLADGTAVISHAQQMLAALEAEIVARVTGSGSAVESYSLDGRSFNKIQLADLYRLRSKYAWEVEMERGGGSPEPVTIQFGPDRGASEFPFGFDRGI